VTVTVIIHDGMLILRPNGVGDRHLRQTLWAIFLKIYRKSSINVPNMGELVKFKFKRCYKLQRDIQQTTLGNLRAELLCAQKLMNPDLFDLLKANPLLEKLPERLRELWNSTTAAPEEAMDTRVMTAEEAVQAMMEMEALESLGIVAEIPKSPHPRKTSRLWYRGAQGTG